MGYESRLIICKKWPESKVTNRIWYQQIMEFDVCKMGWDYRYLFIHNREENANHIYCTMVPDSVNDMDVELDIKTDCYGEELKYATAEELLEWCNRNHSEVYDYWRFRILEDVLHSFERNGGLKDIVVFNYGH